MNWKISNFLPEIVQENFKALIAGYLGSINEKIREFYSNQQQAANKQSSQGTDLESNSQESIVKYSQGLVSGELTEQLMRLTMKIYKKLTDEDFPEQLGCRYKLRCPALEFVKYICKTLSLDKNVQNQVVKLKTDLLTIINVREFSDEAQFVDPSLSFVIPQVCLIKICLNWEFLLNK